MPSQEKLRVMIVDDIPETRENIRRLLQFDTDLEVIATAKSGKEAIEICADAKPDVILMDINMPDMDGIAATEGVRKKLPYVQVIILSVQRNPEYMRRAMLAGARDFITKPPVYDELSAAIHRAGVMALEEKIKFTQSTLNAPRAGVPAFLTSEGSYGKVIVVYSPKGGTGTTTIAINLAVAFRQDDKRVAIIDGDLQYGDVSVFLNETPKNTILDLTPRIDELDAELIAEFMAVHTASGVKILPPPPTPDLSDQINSEQFAKLLLLLRQNNDFIIIDTSSYLSEPVQVALETADAIVLITTPEIPAIKNCNLFLSLIDAGGINRDHIVFVMNRYDNRRSIAPERVGASLHQNVALTIPFDDVYVNNSMNKGVPIVLENKTYPVSKAILMLASMIREKIKQADNATSEIAMKKK
ncbi:MAG: response regulator [Anaerolineaceae bacterium]